MKVFQEKHYILESLFCSKSSAPPLAKGEDNNNGESALPEAKNTKKTLEPPQD
jgi:hypothetical protein